MTNEQTAPDEIDNLFHHIHQAASVSHVDVDAMLAKLETMDPAILASLYGRCGIEIGNKKSLAVVLASFEKGAQILIQSGLLAAL